MFPVCLQGIRAGLRQGGPGRPPAPPAPGICAHRGCVSHTNTQNFSLKLMTVSTAQAGPLIWKSHFATRSALRRTPGSWAPELSLRPPRTGHGRTGSARCAPPGWRLVTS